MKKPIKPAPYAYSISDYDSHYVYPTLTAAAIGAQECGWTLDYLYKEEVVEAHFLDGHTETVSLKDFIEKIDVNEASVAFEIDEKREAARKADELYLKEYVEKHGCLPGVVTGSAPLYMLDRADLIRREVAKRAYRWKF